MTGLILALVWWVPVCAAPESISDGTKSLRKIDGFFPLYWDKECGKLLLEINFRPTPMPDWLPGQPMGVDNDLRPAYSALNCVSMVSNIRCSGNPPRFAGWQIKFDLSQMILSEC